MTQARTPKQKRPIAITIVGVFVFLAAFYNLIAGGVLLWTTDLFDKPVELKLELLNTPDLEEAMTEQNVTILEGGGWLLLGLVQLVLGIGFWRLKRWAWVGIMTWQVVKILADITGFLAPERPVFSLLLAVICVFLLNQADVRRIFGIRVQFPGAATTNATNHALDRQ